MQIIPGILEHDWQSIETKLENLKTFTNSAHIDIIDGKFVDNKTLLDSAPFEKYSDKLFLEIHMMVEAPEEYVERFGKVGFRRFLGQVEQMTSQKDFVATAKKYGEAALALDGPTHISSIKVPFGELDSILIYTSNKVGFSGPPLMEERLDKVRHLRKLTNIPIEVDGGINDKNIELAKSAGANRFVSTGFIWNSENPKEQYSKLVALLS